jgi:hypothetical protein
MVREKSGRLELFSIRVNDGARANDPLEQNRVDFDHVCRNAGIACHILDRRATENYLADAAVKAVMGNNYRALTPYERLKDVSPHRSKEENWRIARMMTKQDLDNTDLGRFLASL